MAPSRSHICDESDRKYRLKKPQRGFAFALLFIALWLRHRQMRIGRLSAGVVVWGEVERRCARDGASARTHTTAPERRNPTKSGRTSAQVVSSFCRNKRTRPSGRNQIKQHRRCCWCHSVQGVVTHHAVQTSIDNNMIKIMPTTDRMVSITVQVLNVSVTVMLKYCFTSQKPASLT